MSGQGYFTWPQGKKLLKYVGHYIDGKMQGKGVLEWSDGRKYTGEFV